MPMVEASDDAVARGSEWSRGSFVGPFDLLEEGLGLSNEMGGKRQRPWVREFVPGEMLSMVVPATGRDSSDEELEVVVVVELVVAVVDMFEKSRTEQNSVDLPTTRTKFDVLWKEV